MTVQTYVKEKYQRDSRTAADDVGMAKGGDWNGPRDAFRHVYTSAVIARDYGQWAAKQAGDDVEKHGDNTDAEHWMDYTNNQTGREIGAWAGENGKTDAEVAQEVKRRIDSGEIIVNPYDPRRTYEQHGDWERAKRESAEQLQRDREETIKKAEKRGQAIEDVNQKFDEWDKNREKEIERQQKERDRKQEKPSKNGGGKSSSSSRKSGGDVFVHPYSRSTGEVKSHMRSRPDGDPSNNRSASSQSHTSNGYREPGPNERKIPGVNYLND